MYKHKPAALFKIRYKSKTLLIPLHVVNSLACRLSVSIIISIVNCICTGILDIHGCMFGNQEHYLVAMGNIFFKYKDIVIMPRFTTDFLISRSIYLDMTTNKVNSSCHVKNVICLLVTPQKR